MAATLVQEPAAPLTAHDRCDRCGAQARTRFTREDAELVFCLHHTTQNELALVAAGWAMVTDQRDELVEKPGVYL